MVVEQPLLERRLVGRRVGRREWEADKCPDHVFGSGRWDVEGFQEQGAGLEGEEVIGFRGLLVAVWEEGGEEA